MRTSPTAPLNDSPIRLPSLSPQKYSSLANRPLSYTPSKLQSNFIYRETIVTKKVQTQKNRIRQLQSLNALLEEKIKHLNEQNVTVRVALQEQIDMYKKMLREQEEEARRLIKGLQVEWKMEMQRVLMGHEEDAKVAQGEREEYERRIQQYINKIEQLQSLFHNQNQTVQGLTNNLHLSHQNLSNTQDKFKTFQYNNLQLISHLQSQIDSLNNRLLHQSSLHKQALASLSLSKTRQFDNLTRLHQTQLQKFQNKKDAQMGQVSMELKEIRGVFEVETMRLQQMINGKDVINQALGVELMKEKERVGALCRNYDGEIVGLVREKDQLIGELREISEDRYMLQNELQSLALLFQTQKSRNSHIISGLHSQISKKNMQLVAENQRLIRAVEQYQRQLMVVGGNVGIVHSEEVRRLILQIKGLKEVLIESSGEMDRCREELLRMEMEIERLMGIIGEQERVLRGRRGI